jgi:hypothetical protein
MTQKPSQLESMDLLFEGCQSPEDILFDDLPEYRFSIYVTHLDLQLDQNWHIYIGRASCENRIKELKADFGLDHFC